MPVRKMVVAKDSVELAEILGLSRYDAHRWELRSQLVEKIKKTVIRAGLTHAELAKRAKTSRTRITSIVNRNIQDVSTDLLLRVLEALGYEFKIVVTKARIAA